MLRFLSFGLLALLLMPLRGHGQSGSCLATERTPTLTSLGVDMVSMGNCATNEAGSSATHKLSSLGSADKKNALRTTGDGLGESRHPSGVVTTETVQVQDEAGTQGLMGEVETRVTSEQIERAAGTLGDPMRYFQMLPGVLSDSDQRNDFLVRGGNPEENLFVVDGIDVPSVNQLALSDTTGGLVSMIDADAIGSMTLHSGAHDARFDDRLSSVVEIATVGNSGGRVLELGLEGLGGMRSWQFGRDPATSGGSLLLSAHRSILNLVTNDIGLNGVPIYNNGLVRGDWTIAPRDRVWGMSLTGIDSIAIRPSATDSVETNPFDVNYHGWRNTTGANWQHVFTPEIFGVLTAENSEQSQAILEYDQQLAETPTYTENTLDGDTTTKYAITARVRRWLMLSGGGTVSQQRVDYGIAQPIPLPSPYSASPVSANTTAVHADFSTPVVGGFGQGTLMGPGAMRLTVAIRGTHWGFDGATRWTPKAFVSMPIGKSRAIGLGYAEYSQMPAYLYLLAFPQNHALLPIEARHLTFDMKDVVRTRKFGMGVGAYKKWYTDYPVAADYPQLSLANIADTFGESFLMFPMLSKGRGQVEGVESNVQWRGTARFRLQGSVTYARAWYSGLDGILRRGNFDIPLSANVAGVWTFGHGLVWSMRYSGASGRPYTPDNLAESLAQNRDVYDLTMINRDRSAPYGRLDVRFEQARRLRSGTITWHAGLDNALNQKNFYSLIWEPNEPKGYQGQSEQYQMPLFPDGGVKYVF
jgi:hypothetical protein